MHMGVIFKKFIKQCGNVINTKHLHLVTRMRGKSNCQGRQGQGYKRPEKCENPRRFTTIIIIIE